jgi:catechol 2,3-dioxygenase-like lactoylglutathione lyase family enzyme
MSYRSRTAGVLFARSLDRIATFYSMVLGLDEVNRDADHILLESPGFQLVVHRITGGGSSPAEITTPPTRRAAVAFKPVFFVSSISDLRGIAESHGGIIEPADREWSFNGVTVCDGLDPEGNVIQFREHAG